MISWSFYLQNKISYADKMMIFMLNQALYHDRRPYWSDTSIQGGKPGTILNAFYCNNSRTNFADFFYNMDTKTVEKLARMTHESR